MATTSGAWDEADISGGLTERPLSPEADAWVTLADGDCLPPTGKQRPIAGANSRGSYCGVYQIGEVTARSCNVIVTSGVIFTLDRTAS